MLRIGLSDRVELIIYLLLIQHFASYYSRDSPLFKKKQKKKLSDDITVWLTNVARDM